VVFYGFNVAEKRFASQRFAQIILSAFIAPGCSPRVENHEWYGIQALHHCAFELKLSPGATRVVGEVHLD
jgi:hypothetical protein